MNLAMYTIKKEQSLFEALEKISGNHERCVFVTTYEGKVIGVLTQGDILRALIKNVNIYASVDKVYSRSFRYLFNRDYEKAFDYFQNDGLLLLPIVDKEFKLTGLIRIKDIFQYLQEKNMGQDGSL